MASPHIMATNTMSRMLRKSLFQTKIPLSALPPTFLLPSQIRYFNSTAQTCELLRTNELDNSQVPSLAEIVTAKPLTTSPNSASPRRTPPTAPQNSETPSGPLSSSVKQLLPLLLAQPSHFITAHIHARPYLLTAGDIVRLPFHMPGVVPGDVLRLNRASAIGSRDYTLKGAPYVDERIFECRATVMGTEGEPVRVKEKTKRRNRRIKTVRSKHKFTVLRISQLRVNGLAEIEA